MRISLEDNDPGHICISKAKDYAVYFNGEHQEYVITADEEKGYLRCFVIRNGLLSLCGDELETRDYFGKVRIETIRI